MASRGVSKCKLGGKAVQSAVTGGEASPHTSVTSNEDVSKCDFAPVETQNFASLQPPYCIKHCKSIVLVVDMMYASYLQPQ